MDLGDRSEAMRTALLMHLGVEDESQVSAEDLAGIMSFELGGDRHHSVKTDDLSLKAGDFKGMHNCLDVRIKDYQGLTQLPPGLFSGLTSMSILVLSGNGITELQEGVFEGLNQLRHLDLSNNPIESVHPLVFKPFKSGSLEFISLPERTAAIIPFPAGLEAVDVHLSDVEFDASTGLEP